MNLGTLFVVATPLGNLQDLSVRAAEILRTADGIICEDSRVTSKLLTHLGARVPLIVCHQHSLSGAANRIAGLLTAGKNLALVTDAGTPAISDPGGRLVQELVQRFGPALKIAPVPGPAAATALLSVAGLPADSFLFLGFPPAKKGRAKFFERVAESPDTVVFYESPHRIQRTLAELRERLAGSGPAFGARPVVVGRELTKMFETIYRGTLATAITLVPEKDQRGEFVIAVGAL